MRGPEGEKAEVARFHIEEHHRATTDSVRWVIFGDEEGWLGRQIVYSNPIGVYSSFYDRFIDAIPPPSNFSHSL